MLYFVCLWVSPIGCANLKVPTCTQLKIFNFQVRLYCWRQLSFYSFIRRFYNICIFGNFCKCFIFDRSQAFSTGCPNFKTLLASDRKLQILKGNDYFDIYILVLYALVVSSRSKRYNVCRTTRLASAKATRDGLEISYQGSSHGGSTGSK